jgi:hypothetical protein
MTLDLNVFTNFTANRVERLPIFATLHSFEAAFGFGDFSAIRVFCHAAPLRVPFEALHAALRAAIPGRSIELYSTRGLADGYVRSVALSAADVLFQLEHDYRFDAASVRHGIAAIARAMQDAAVPYLRFNIGANQDNALDRLTPFDMAGIPCCRTVIFSNHPHLVDRAYAREHYVAHIDRRRGGSRGIEAELTAAHRAGWIYGPLRHPPVIAHIDGRADTRQWRGERLSYRLAEFAARNAKIVRERFGLGRYGRIY